MNAPDSLKLRIEGMDCAACAVKIENAMKRLPGVSDINVSYGQESLSLRYDEDRRWVLHRSAAVRMGQPLPLVRWPALGRHGGGGVKLTLCWPSPRCSGARLRWRILSRPWRNGHTPWRR